MAVYKRTYKPYEGALSPEWSRFAILSRYSFKTVFQSKLLVSFFAMCFLPHLVAMSLIYLRHNLGLAETLDLADSPVFAMLAIDGRFFEVLFTVETFLTFFIVSFVAPNLIAPDLANNALPLYLSRPLSRKEYVLGKVAVLATLTSLVTWIPGLFLTGVQSNFAGFSWLWDNMRIVVGMVVGSWIWIITISLMSLALSAWVRLKPVAIASLFCAFFAGASFGEVTNVVLNLDPKWGSLLNVATDMRMLWDWFFNGTSSGAGQIPAWTALIPISLICAVSLSLLLKKIRPTEVVR